MHKLDADRNFRGLGKVEEKAQTTLQLRVHKSPGTFTDRQLGNLFNRYPSSFFLDFA